MAFWDDAKKKVLQAMKPHQQEERMPFSNRADGGFSGYQPRMPRVQNEPATAGYQRGSNNLEAMMPSGVDAASMQFQPVGGQTGTMQPVQPMQQPMQPPQSAAQPQQAQFGRTGFQQPVRAAQPHPQFQGNGMNQPFPQGAFAQPTRPGFGQPAFAQNAPQGTMQMNMPGTMQMGVQNGMPQPAPQAAPQPAVSQESNTFAFSGGDSYMVDGNAYKMIFRVAQITGVPSCFRVIEFMYNNEAVIVNAEQVTDLVEADRCMDLIFGAACAMKQRLIRVSGKQIYLITPPQVYVAPFEGLRRAGMADIERRWPGAMQSGMQPQAAPNNIQQMQQPGFAQQRQDDYAGGFGRRSARSAAHANGYTDFGGFNVK